MANNAKINLVGNLTKDPTTRQIGAGNVVQLSVAVSTMNKAPDGTYLSDFYDVSVWGKNGEYLMDKVQKGTQVWATGDFSTSEYTAQDGQKRTALRVNASDVRPLQRLKGEGGGAPTRGGYQNNRGRSGYQGGYQEQPGAMPF